jgi:hypothetical protein
MRKIVLAGCVLAVMLIPGFSQEVTMGSQSDSRIEQAHSRWVQHVLRSIGTIRPGMTRKDLAPMLVLDGGLQFPGHGRFVYAKCDFIKVDIDFAVTDEGSTFSPDDKVVKVSRPYLESPVTD